MATDSDYMITDDGLVITAFGTWVLPTGLLHRFPKKAMLWANGKVTPDGRYPGDEAARRYISDEVDRHERAFGNGAEFRPRTMQEWAKSA